MVTWDFKGYGEMSTSCMQQDWNHTLITTIHGQSAKMHQESLRAGANTLVVPPDVLPILEGMFYYNVTDEILCGKYKVVVDIDAASNTITLSHNKQHNLVKVIQVLNH